MPQIPVHLLGTVAAANAEPLCSAPSAAPLAAQQLYPVFSRPRPLGGLWNGPLFPVGAVASSGRKGAHQGLRGAFISEDGGTVSVQPKLERPLAAAPCLRQVIASCFVHNFKWTEMGTMGKRF